MTGTEPECREAGGSRARWACEWKSSDGMGEFSLHRSGLDEPRTASSS